VIKEPAKKVISNILWYTKFASLISLLFLSSH
jgi:hypothetical protein